ncbi:MAG: hypothetical protein Q9197_005998 [Variospora fuerteventurae]
METSLPTNGEPNEAMTDKFQGINLRRGGEAWMYIGNLPFKWVSTQTGRKAQLINVRRHQDRIVHIYNALQATATRFQQSDFDKKSAELPFSHEFWRFMMHNSSTGRTHQLIPRLIVSNTHQNQNVRGEKGFSLRVLSRLAKSGANRPGTYLVLNGKGAGYICTTSFGAVRSDSVAFRIMRLHNCIQEGHHPFDPATHDLARENKWVPQLKLMKDFRWDDMKWRIRVLSVAYCEPRAHDQRTIAQQYLNLLATIDIIYHGTFVKPSDPRAAESGHLPSLSLAQTIRPRNWPPEIGLGQNLILPCAT